MGVKTGIHIGQLLVFKNIITREQLSLALEEQRRTKDFICNILIKLGLSTEDKIYPVLAEQLGVDYIKLRDFHLQDRHILDLIPRKLASYYKIMPLKLEGNCISVATNDPLSNRLMKELRQLLGIDIKMILAGESDILEAIGRYYGNEDKTSQQDIKGTGDLSEDPLVTRLANQIFALSIEQQAVDIHMEHLKDELKMRFKIRGNFYEISIKRSEVI